MPDDWNSRIRSTTNYLDRSKDQKDFESGQAANRDAVDQANISGNEVQARSALGITSRPRGRFTERLDSLARAARSSGMPDAERWAERLQGIARGSAGARALREFAAAYDQFYQTTQHDIDLDIQKGAIVCDVLALMDMVDG